MNQYYDFLKLDNEQEYYNYYLQELCSTSIYCFDSLEVRFSPKIFKHAFYERSKRYYKNKDIFSYNRAKRMSWIPLCLQDDSLTPLAGYDKRRKRYDHNRRVTLITPDNFVVVIRLIKANISQFVTCFVVDNRTVERKIKSSPVWNPQKIKINDY